MGYRYFETDAHVTRDGVVVAFHDPRLDRVTDRVGAIAELTAAEVEAADAGYARSPSPVPQRRRASCPGREPTASKSPTAGTWCPW